LKRGKIIVKQSLSDAYRQYLEDVTIPMNTYLDAPEEFVTTKPSIYHSLRMQPATDARTGRVRNSPAKARALSSHDNLLFQNDIKDWSLPLSTNQGLPLYGRHVYPGELYSFNPSFGKETHLPDLPVTYKQTWGDGTRNRPLNLYGFTGNAPTPQRFTSSTFQPEGIIYGNLDENDVIQLNTRPASAERFAQVARALSPFHPRRDIKHLGVHSEDLARDIMDAGIPPILAESNVDTRGRIHHLPFRLDEPIDVQEAHDPFAQYDMGNLNRPTPQGLEQFTLDAIRAGEPMDLAFRLLKMPIISDSPEIKQLDSGPAHIHQFQDPVTGEVKPLYISPASNPTSENLYAGIVGDNGDRASAKFNTGDGDYASLDGVETQEPYRRRGYMSAIYDAMDEYLEQNKKGRRLVPSNFQSDEGKAFWESRKKSEPMKIAMQLLKEEIPYSSKDYPPQEISISTGNPLVTPKIAGETPEVCNMPGCESGLPPVMYRRMANPIRSIDNHEFMCEQCAYKHDLQSLLFDKMIKGEITPMEYAMQLLKQEPLQLRNSAELAELARQGDTEAYNEMMERTSDYYLANEITGEPDMEANLEAYGAETGKNPFKTPPIGRTNQIQIHQPPVTPIHADKKLHNWQYKNASEPMNIAMRLLKGEYEDIPKEEHRNYYAGSLNALPGHKPGCDLRLNGYYPHYSASKYSGKCTCEAQCANCGAKEKWGYPYNDTDLCFDCTENMAGQGVINDPLMNWMHSQPGGMPSPKTDDEDWRSNIETGEPMDIALQLLKERVSPEAKRHKLEYDKKYESSPERVKYREELNRERRRRHIMGRGGPDMSHTKDHTIVPESPHTNRARHFKDKGTLL